MWATQKTNREIIWRILFGKQDLRQTYTKLDRILDKTHTKQQLWATWLKHVHQLNTMNLDKKKFAILNGFFLLIREIDESSIDDYKLWSTMVVSTSIKVLQPSHTKLYGQQGNWFLFHGILLLVWLVRLIGFVIFN